MEHGFDFPVYAVMLSVIGSFCQVMRLVLDKDIKATFFLVPIRLCFFLSYVPQSPQFKGLINLICWNVCITFISLLTLYRIPYFHTFFLIITFVVLTNYLPSKILQDDVLDEIILEICLTNEILGFLLFIVWLACLAITYKDWLPQETDTMTNTYFYEPHMNKVLFLNKIFTNNETSCSICLSEFNDDLEHSENHAVSLTCGHVYHESCIVPWLQKVFVCPLCRLTPSSFRPNEGSYKSVQEMNLVNSLEGT